MAVAAAVKAAAARAVARVAAAAVRDAAVARAEAVPAAARVRLHRANLNPSLAQRGRGTIRRMVEGAPIRWAQRSWIGPLRQAYACHLHR